MSFRPRALIAALAHAVIGAFRPAHLARNAAPLIPSQAQPHGHAATQGARRVGQRHPEVSRNPGSQQVHASRRALFQQGRADEARRLLNDQAPGQRMRHKRPYLGHLAPFLVKVP